MLRKAYIKAFKENLKIQLDSITILDAIHNLDEEELDELEEDLETEKKLTDEEKEN